MNVREEFHRQFCRDDQCFIDYDESGRNCSLLDRSLEAIEETRLHREAEKLRILVETTGRVIGYGLLVAIDKIDPYEKIERLDPAAHETRSNESRIDPRCQKCVNGLEHWHRKVDGSLIEWDVSFENRKSSDS